MPKLSREERAELEARLAADDDDSDNDDQVSLTLPSGANLTGTFRRVSEFAAAHGLKLIPDPPADDKPKSDAGNVKRFSGRRVS